MSVIASEVVGTNQPGTEDQADNLSSFSFDGLHEKAMAHGSEAGTPVTQEQVAAPDAGVADAPAQNIDNASQAKLAALGDDDLVSVTVKGEEVTLPWKEAKAGVMRQQDYTRSKQQLATERQQFEASSADYKTAQQERNALATLLNDEKLVAQFLQAKYPHLLNGQQSQPGAGRVAAGVDPDDIPTVGQVQEQITNLVEQLRKEVTESVEAGTVRMEDRMASAKLATEINSTIEGLFNEHPYIKEVNPRAADILRYEVLQLHPQTHEETIQAFRDVFGGMVEGFKSAVAKTTKQSVINKQKLVGNNIQPSGGAQVQPVPTQVVKDGKIDWKALNTAAMAFGE